MRKEKKEPHPRSHVLASHVPMSHLSRPHPAGNKNHQLSSSLPHPSPWSSHCTVLPYIACFSSEFCFCNFFVPSSVSHSYGKKTGLRKYPSFHLVVPVLPLHRHTHTRPHTHTHTLTPVRTITPKPGVSKCGHASTQQLSPLWNSSVPKPHLALPSPTSKNPEPYHRSPINPTNSLRSRPWYSFSAIPVPLYSGPFCPT